MPPWTEVRASVDVICGLHQRLSDVYKEADIDVVVVGIFHQVQIWAAESHPFYSSGNEPHSAITGSSKRVHVLHADFVQQRPCMPHCCLQAAPLLPLVLTTQRHAGCRVAGGRSSPHPVLGAGP